MFERYTEKTRRVIFFGRYEASQFGSPYIETEHLLLGLLREDKALTHRCLHSQANVEAIRNQIETHTTFQEKTSTSVDLPLSDDSKRVLAYAAEEAERLSDKHIGTEHLLLGLLRERRTFAAQLLNSQGASLDRTREIVSKWQKNRIRIFERLKHSIQLLACPPETQLRMLPSFVCKADELALDFDHWHEVALANFRSELTRDQLCSLGAVAHSISHMTRVGPTLWTEIAVRESSEWNVVRTLAAAALNSFGWPFETPPSHADEFVGGS